MSGDYDALAMYAYHQGTPPMDWAEKRVVQLIEVHQMVAASRAQNPATFPGYCIELTPSALARRILGELLDAGWVCPDAGQVLQGYKPTELEPAKRAALEAATDYLVGLPDSGVLAWRQAETELGTYAPVVDLIIRAAEIARKAGGREAS